jgi:hypothetical protein
LTKGDIININNFLKEFDNLKIIEILKDKIKFIIEELLMTSYEYNNLLKSKKDEVDIKSSIESKIEIYENDKFMKIEYSDNEDGLNVDMFKPIVNSLYERTINKIKPITDGFFYNSKGNGAYIFFYKDK